MNVYDQIQSLDPGTEVTIALRGTVKEWGSEHVFEVGGSHWLTASLAHAESITVHEPEPDHPKVGDTLLRYGTEEA